MNIEKLHKLFDIYKKENELSWEGVCCDCHKQIEVIVVLTNSGFSVKGGAVYEKGEDRYAIKCEECFNKNPHIYQECEVYSRVVGYLRPISQWNDGKVSEWKDRKTFNIR